MTHQACVWMACVLLAGTSGRVGAAERPPTSAEAAYARLPLHFEPNLGQVSSAVEYVGRGGGYAVYLTGAEAVLDLQPKSGHRTVRLRFVGAKRDAALRPGEELGGTSNYLLGRDPAGWRTGVPHYGRIDAVQVYPGIDVSFHGEHGQFEYDFLVAPGADLRQIRVAVAGVEGVRVEGGELVLDTKKGEVRQRAPVAFQETAGGARQNVPVRYVRYGRREFGFAAGAYDRSRALVIDPILAYSTYLGGGGFDAANAISGHAFQGGFVVAGRTESLNFPTLGAVQPAYGGGGSDAFVARLAPGGAQLLYATYLGGNGWDEAHGVALERDGRVYVVGRTSSTNFPVVAPIQGTNGGQFDAFMARLNSTGSALEFSTYFGGSADDVAYGVGIYGEGPLAVVAGTTSSSNFPVQFAIQPTLGGGKDAFVARLSQSGSSLVYSTYLGGSADDEARAVVQDGNSAWASIAGTTRSVNFPVVSAYQTTNAGGADAFVSTLQNPGGAGLTLSTYLGGSGDDIALGLDASGDVVGSTTSTNFPLVNPVQASYGGGTVLGDAFVARLLADTLAFATYLGGSGEDRATAVAAEPDGGSLHVTGETGSPNFPVRGALYGPRGGIDAFLARFSIVPPSLEFSTYLGGGGNDAAQGIFLDFRGPYVAGSTTSTDLPTFTPLQAANAGTSDAFVAHIRQTAPCAAPSLTGPTYSDTVLTGKDLVLGDFNEDGRRDVAVAGDLGIAVLIGNGLGGFGSPAFFSAGGGPRAIGTALLNGDNHLDLVVANETSDNVSVLLGNGAGGFGPAVSFAVGDAPNSLVLASFNVDAFMDLAVANSGSGGVSVLLGNGAGGFGAPTNYFTGGSPVAVRSGDLDGDGDADLSVSGGGVWVIFGDGLGGFGAPVPLPTAGLTLGLHEVADVDVDGSLDLVVTNANIQDRAVLLRGNGAGAFAAPTPLPVAIQSLADFNLDGVPDFAWGQGFITTGRVVVAPGDGAGGAGPLVSYETGALRSPVAGFVDADLRPDVAFLRDQMVGVFLNAFFPCATDFNLDGPPDFAWRHAVSGQNVLWYLVSGGTVIRLQSGQLTDPPALPDTGWRIVGTNDFNRDRRPDLLWRHASSGENVVWYMSGNRLVSGTFTTPAALVDVNWDMGGTGDFNVDGWPDILWRHRISGENVVWYMNGSVLTSGTFLTPASLPDTNWRMGGTGDFNRDGKMDIVWYHQVSGQVVIWFMNGATLVSGTLVNGTMTDTNWRIVATGDYTGDGKVDIVWHHGSTGQIIVWEMNGATVIGSLPTLPAAMPDVGWRIVGPR